MPFRVFQFRPDRKRVTDPASERDRRIARRLQDLFERELALSDIGGLQFFVHRGSVVLKGDLSDASDREMVTELIRSVPEVRRVIDHMDAAADAA